MAFSLSIQVTKAPWLDNPAERWNAGLERAGLAWRTSNSRGTYPPLAPSYPNRSYRFADDSDFEITDPGRSMDFGSTFYAPFILFGTRKWAGWQGHLDASVGMMKDGFAAGVAEYSV